MDNASGNVPNVSPGIEGGKRGENGERQAEKIRLVEEPESIQMAGMMETILPRREAPPRPRETPPPGTGPLDNTTLLYSPTPIDRDPPPLSDVKPLSAPVAVRRPAGSAAQPASSVARQAAPVPAPSRKPEPAQRPGGAPQPRPAVPAQAGPSAPDSAKRAPVAQPKPAPEARVAPRPGQAPGHQPQGVSVNPPAPSRETPIPRQAEIRIPEPSPAPRPQPAVKSDPSALPEPRMEGEPTRKVLVLPSSENDAAEETKPLLPLDTLLAELESELGPKSELPLIEDSEPELEAIGEESPLLEAELPEEDIELSDTSNSLPPLLLTPQVEEIPEVFEPGETAVDGELPVSGPDEETEVEETGSPEKSFQEETLLADPRITQRVAPLGDPKSEGYVKNEFFVSEGAEDPWILPAAATSGLAANHKKRRIVGKFNIGIWSAFTSIFFFGAILVIGAAAIAWSMRGAIGNRIEASVKKRVEDSGYFVSYKGWEYDPVRGLVLEGVTVFESEDRIIPYAKIDNIGLNTDVFALWKTKDALKLKKTVSFRDSNLVLFDQGGEVAHFKGLKGFLELDQNRVGLEGLRGQIEGTLFEVDGDVTLRSDSDAVALWNSHSASSSVATSSSGKRRTMTSHHWFRASPWKALLAQAQSDSIIIRDDRAPGSGKALDEIEIPLPDPDAAEESSRPMFAPRSDISVSSPPDDPDPTVAEAPLAEEVTVPPPVVDEIPSIPSPDPESSTVPETIEVPAPDLVSSEPATPEINPGTSDSKKAVLPSLAFLDDISRYFTIKSKGTPPLVTARVSVDLSDREAPKINATGRLTGDSITMQQTGMKGITFQAVDAPYSYDHQKGLLQLPGFKFGYGGAGRVTGNARYNIPTKVLELSEVHSNIDLPALLTEIDPVTKEVLKNIKFLDSPEIYIGKSQIPVENPLEGQIDFSYEQWDGIEFNSPGKKLFINEIRGDFKLAGGVLSIPGLKARVFDGPVDVIGSLRLKDPSYPFNGSIKARGLSMNSIAEYAAIESQYMKGSLSLDYQGVVAGEISKMGGSGRVDLQNAQLLKVPVIGPIQRLLGAAIPVFGAETPNMLAGNFIIDSGVLMTSDLLVHGDGTVVAVKGQADLARKLTAFSAKANLEGPLGFVTGLTDETIEVDGRGPLFSPQIRLKGGSLPAGFSADNVKTILGIPDGSAEAISAVMQEIAAGSGGVGELINGVGGSGPPRGNRSDPEDNASSAVQRAGEVIDGIKNGGGVKAVSDGLQGLLGGGR